MYRVLQGGPGFAAGPAFSPAQGSPTFPQQASTYLPVQSSGSTFDISSIMNMMMMMMVMVMMMKMMKGAMDTAT